MSRHHRILFIGIIDAVVVAVLYEDRIYEFVDVVEIVVQFLCLGTICVKFHDAHTHQLLEILELFNF